MINVLWVTGGLVKNDKLAEALRSVKDKQCMVIKVGSVQEAIVELFEGEHDISLIICDQILEMSLPKRELRRYANRHKVPYLVADEGQSLLATQMFCTNITKALQGVISKLSIVNVRGCQADYAPLTPHVAVCN